jgi:23S rRNA (guanine2445-N2)-methyltransferase / 23S rRNA (guanine2069-N7)-methyltransferase
VTLKLIATTAFGLEAITRRELANLGYEGHITGPGWIRFDGDFAAICRTNLWLRTADRILVEVKSFHAEDFDTLFETTKAIDWDAWLAADASFPVSGRSIKSQLSSVPACQRAVKKAIVESLCRGHGTANLPETGPLYKIEVALLKNLVTLTIDTTGPSLHKRGYRRRAAQAPLKETLAAALVLLSFWKPDRPFIDPFCGSGTIPIEAALIGRNLAPGLQRTFAAEAWPNLPDSRWHEARVEARDKVSPTFPERLIGTDIDSWVLQAARDNAEQAGVSDQIHFQMKPFAQLTSKRQFGCVVTNPPYGQRIGEQEELLSLYRSIPEVLRKIPTWSHFVLTAYPDFESLIQRPADRRRKLYNGRIECTYYQFHGPRPGATPESPHSTDSTHKATEVAVDQATDGGKRSHGGKQQRVSLPAFGGLTPKAREQEELFRSRLVKRARHLRRWPTRHGISCYRIYDRDIPEIPLVVDRYEDHLHLSEYERPHDRDLAQHADWLDAMANTAADALQIKPSNVFMKRRYRQRGDSQHQPVSEERYELTVREGGLQFIVNLSDYVDTGLFLDHRVTRSMVREASKEARVLNLFGYTGAFSVYSASGGASHTTTVDWSHSYLNWAERNMALNGFQGRHHEFVREDARTFLRALRPEVFYDVAIVDPPTFSNSKRTDDDWNIQRDHAGLLNGLLRHMRPGGVVFFSTNFRRFKFDPSAILAARIHEISRQTVPADFRNRRIHRCWRIEIGN